MSYPYYALVKKDLKANLEQRAELYTLGGRDPAAAREIKIMCARDLLFYVNLFCWTYDPRLTKCPLQPFITYRGFQDDVLDELSRKIGREHLLIEKTRDMGVSWMVLYVMDHLWLFTPLQSFLLVSRKEEYVDAPGDKKALFPKLDFNWEYQPKWFRPAVNRSCMHRENAENKSVFDGESTNQDVGAGDRRTAVLLDEYSRVRDGRRIREAMADVTDSSIYVATPRGQGNDFYQVKKTTNIRVLTVHWEKHPIKARGLYRLEKGKLELLDSEYWSKHDPASYAFVDNSDPNKLGKWPVRSPWYDRKCLERGHPLLIAETLDIDYLTTSNRFFPEELMERIEREDVCPPVLEGDFTFDAAKINAGTFFERINGSFRLWIKLDAGGRPPVDQEYAIGCDVSMGTGATNSALSVIGRSTREKVCEFCSKIMPPHEFAELAAAVGWWFIGKRGLGALLNFESIGPGISFCRSLLNSGYRRLYLRRKSDRAGETPQFQEGYGWDPTPKSKYHLFLDFYRSLARKRLTIHSRMSVDEYREYVYQTGPVQSTVVHEAALDKDDPAGSGGNHGDMAVADALAWLAVQDDGTDRIRHDVDDEDHAPVGSPAHRLRPERTTTDWKSRRNEVGSWRRR
jgi:hypothetical protein